MAILGLLLALATAAFTADVVVQNANTITGEAVGQTITGLTLGGVFVAGAVIGAVFLLGIAMLVGGLGRRRRRRRERALRHERLEAENARLEAELARRPENHRPAEHHRPADDPRLTEPYPAESTTRLSTADADHTVLGDGRHRA